jgi:hypothetical protein
MLFPKQLGRSPGSSFQKPMLHAAFAMGFAPTAALLVVAGASSPDDSSMLGALAQMCPSITAAGSFHPQPSTRDGFGCR